MHTTHTSSTYEGSTCAAAAASGCPRIWCRSSSDSCQYSAPPIISPRGNACSRCSSITLRSNKGKSAQSSSRDISDTTVSNTKSDVHRLSTTRARCRSPRCCLVRVAVREKWGTQERHPTDDIICGTPRWIFHRFSVYSWFWFISVRVESVRSKKKLCRCG